MGATAFQKPNERTDPSPLKKGRGRRVPETSPTLNRTRGRGPAVQDLAESHMRVTVPQPRSRSVKPSQTWSNQMGNAAGGHAAYRRAVTFTSWSNLVAPGRTWSKLVKLQGREMGSMGIRGPMGQMRRMGVRAGRAQSHLVALGQTWSNLVKPNGKRRVGARGLQARRDVHTLVALGRSWSK